MLFKDVFQVKSNDLASFTTFEYLNVLGKSAESCLNIIVLYRPPNTSFRLFIDEFSILLEQIILLSGFLLIVGDFMSTTQMTVKPPVSSA